MKKQFFVLSLTLLFSLILTGCNLPGQQTPTSPVDMLNTAAAQTLQAQQTSIVQTNQAGIQEPTPTATQQPTGEIISPTITPVPTNTEVILPSPTPTKTIETACDQASFVSETIPDGTEFEPEEEFTKTWTLKNAGSCTWTADYDVVFVSGNAMDASAATQLTNAVVPPGASVKISLNLETPDKAGTYKADFKLRNANGVLFGVGDQNKTFWVEIEVKEVAKVTHYDFTQHYCDTNVLWTGTAGDLPCPGILHDDDGWIYKINNPILETGNYAGEPGLQLHTPDGNNTFIKGIFPQMTVPEGAFFKATIGCYATNNDCDVWFKLNYIVEGSTEKTLAKWQEVQDGKVNNVSVDLKDIVGKKVTFILLVESNGSSKQDKAMWFQPLIVK